MKNIYMAEKELNVKVGDRVACHGYRGTVTNVYRGYSKEWNGAEYVKQEGSDYTNVAIHFDEDQDIARYGQYQNGTYGEFEVI